ncbi:MAG TPA: hypothetical protein VFF67_08735 [Thermoplasmata archaeon]|nr:hypothetical protein [Thermoplasmata archaeon]
MDPVDRELMQGMGNCYSACGEGFEATIDMVSNARDRTPDDVIAALRRLRADFATDPEYRALRARFPADFPV